MSLFINIGVEHSSRRFDGGVDNYFHLDVIFHPNQQILGYCTLDVFRSTIPLSQVNLLK